MNKILLITGLSLFCSAALSAAGIAVVSTNTGQNTLLRANRKMKFASGAILEHFDLLETGTDSALACKFADSGATCQLFSHATARVNSTPWLEGWNNEVELGQGSVYVRRQPGPGIFTVTSGMVRVRSQSASFLVKKAGGGKTRLTVLEGSVEVANESGAATVEAGKTAEFSDRGELKVFPARDSDLSPEELALLEPSPLQGQRAITVPMADHRGRVRYLELVW